MGGTYGLGAGENLTPSIIALVLYSLPAGWLALRTPSPAHLTNKYRSWAWWIDTGLSDKRLTSVFSVYFLASTSALPLAVLIHLRNSLITKSLPICKQNTTRYQCQEMNFNRKREQRNKNELLILRCRLITILWYGKSTPVSEKKSMFPRYGSYILRNAP